MPGNNYPFRFNLFQYPHSYLLGDRPCGVNATPKEWQDLGAPSNQPVYPNAPKESCGNNNIGKSCTPHPRFKDGDNNLAISRKILRDANNRVFFSDTLIKQLMSNPSIYPLTISTPMTNVSLNPNLNSAAVVNGPTNQSTPEYQWTSSGLTPFRRLTNSGDPNMSNNSTTLHRGAQAGGVWVTDVLNPMYFGGSNQVSSTRRASNASATRLGGSLNEKSPQTQQSLSNLFLNREVAMWSGNNKWVYDGADYVRFKKLQASNRNYNDITYGGDRNNASQVAISRVRRR
tara:strand:+ start:286 stop:1146 length:861 start_codon:yes stop_codon:yes gene_type:complete